MDLEASFVSLRSKAQEWADLPVSSKLKFIELVAANVHKYRDEYFLGAKERRECASPSAELGAASLSYTHASLYMNSLRSLWQPTNYNSLIASAKKEVGAGKRRVTVGPSDFVSKIAAGFATMELIFAEGTKEIQHQAPWTKPPGVASILGASNYDFPYEIPSALFSKNHVAMYKPSPISHKLVDPWRKIFAPLIEAGYLVILDESSVEVAQKMITHQQTDLWFMTGSHLTAERIFQMPQKPQRKSFVVELGNCTPCVIIPSEWSLEELTLNAKFMAFISVFNGGHVCCHPQVVVTCGEWKQREEFIALYKRFLEASEAITEFYPDLPAKKLRLKEALEAAKHDEDSPVTIKTVGGNDVIFASGCREDCPLLTQEAFCAAVAEVRLDCDAASFCGEATRLLNDKKQTWGSLAAMIIAQDTKDSSVLNLTQDLKYGCVAINTPAMSCCIWPQLPWGGMPGTGSIEDPMSGIGCMNSCLGLDNIEKGVITAPFCGPSLRLQTSTGNDAMAAQEAMKKLTKAAANGKSSFFFRKWVEFLMLMSMAKYV